MRAPTGCAPAAIGPDGTCVPGLELDLHRLLRNRAHVVGQSASLVRSLFNPPARRSSTLDRTASLVSLTPAAQWRDGMACTLRGAVEREIHR